MFEKIKKRDGRIVEFDSSNFVNSDMSPEDARSMCCRLRLDNRELLKRGGGLFGANPLTGSIGVVAINLPRIGYASKIKNEFYSHLIERIQLAVKSLSIKRKILEKFTEKHLFNYSDDIFETLRLRDELQTKYNGGTVLHIFLGEQVNDMEVLKGLIRKIANNYRLPYFTLTPTFSICPSHGYLAGEQETCSICDQKTEVYSRVVGYLRPVRQWNEGVGTFD